MTSGGTQESGAGGHSGHEATRGVDAGKATSAAANKAVAGGSHGARPELRGRIVGWRGNLAGEPSRVRGDKGGREASGVAHEPLGVRDEEGGRKASEVTEKPRGYRQGVGGGVKLLQGIDTPRVAELPRGDKTPGVPTKGEGVLGEDRRGRGGDGNPPTTRATEAQGLGGGAKERMGGPRMVAPPHPQQDMAADIKIAGTLLMHTAGTDSVRPEHGALTRHKYGLLAPIWTVVDPAAAGYQGSGNIHEATRGTAGQAWRGT